MTSEQSTQRAIGLIRKDIDGGDDTDMHTLAERHGYQLVFTIYTDCGPLASSLIVAQHVIEHGAAAVVVPSLAHAHAIRYMVTDLATLVTPVQQYPRGHRWPVAECAELDTDEGQR